MSQSSYPRKPEARLAARARGRLGVALEVLLASALLVAAVIPLYTLIGTSDHIAYLDEFQVLARRRALEALSVLEGHPPAFLLQAATGGPPPLELRDPRLSPSAREVFLPLPASGLDVTLENLPRDAQRYYLSRVAHVPVRAFVEELEPGLIRLSVMVTWVDPVSRTGRSLVSCRLVEAPFPWVRTL